MSAQVPTASMRRTERRTLLPLQRIQVVISSKHLQISAKTYTMSPYGVGVKVSATDAKQFAIGEEVQVEFQKRDRKYLVIGAVVHVTELLDEEGCILGVSYLQKSLTPDDPQEKRTSERLSCPEFFSPICWTRSPLIHQEKIFLRATDMSSSGLRLVTSSRNKGLFPGLEMPLHIVLPTVGTFQVKTVVAFVHPSPNGERYAVGVRFVDARTEFQNALSQYVLETHPSLSISELRRRKFRVLKLGDSVRVTLPSSEEDMQEMLKLRLDAYSSTVLKGKNVDDPHRLTDQFDPFATHLMFRVGDELVGAGRLLIVNESQPRCETIDVRKFTLPDDMRGVVFAEAGRASLKSTYQGNCDLFFHILHSSLRMAVEAGAEYIICNCATELVPLYKRVTFTEFDTPHEVEVFGTKTMLHAMRTVRLCHENYVKAVAGSETNRKLLEEFL